MQMSCNYDITKQTVIISMMSYFDKPKVRNVLFEYRIEALNTHKCSLKHISGVIL